MGDELRGAEPGASLRKSLSSSVTPDEVPAPLNWKLPTIHPPFQNLPGQIILPSALDEGVPVTRISSLLLVPLRLKNPVGTYSLKQRFSHFTWGSC